MSRKEPSPPAKPKPKYTVGAKSYVELTLPDAGHSYGISHDATRRLDRGEARKLADLLREAADRL